MEFENYERARKQLAFALFWLSANIIGCAFGWSIAETVGRWLNETTQWSLAVAVATVIFELILWACRSSVLLLVGDYASLKPLDIVILLIAESFGWLLGEGFYEVTGPSWPSAGPVWAVLLASSLWMIIWVMRQPRRGTRWWAVTTTIWTLLGFLGVSLVMGIGLTLSLEAGDWANEVFNAIIGRATSGAVLGFFAGILTGLPFVRLLKWSDLTRL